MSIRKLLIASLVMAFSGASVAVERGEINPLVSYKLGGYSKMQSRKSTKMGGGATAEWKFPVCGDFSLATSVTDILSDAQSQINNLSDQLVASATSVISNWAWIELARADPQLYEALQQGKLEASEYFRVAVNECQQVIENIAENGYESSANAGTWVKTSGLEYWKEQSTSGTNVVNVANNADKEGRKEGITWVGGTKAAGQNQPPIKVVADIVKAGSNTLARKPVTNTATFEDTSGNDYTPWFSDYWDTPSDAIDWIVDLVGEQEICLACTDTMKHKAGRGVYGILQEKQEEVALAINDLIDDTTKNVYTKADLDDVSTPTFRVESQVLEALKNEDIYRDSFINLLAEEVAVADTVERLIAARRILITGSQEPNVKEALPAQEVVKAKVSEIEQEMNLLRQDMQFRESTRRSVAVSIMERQQSRVDGSEGKSFEGLITPLREINNVRD